MALLDQEISARVKEALASDPGIADVDLEIETHQGVVYLRGEVDSPDQIARATKVASELEGVGEVRNQLVALPLRRPEVKPEIIWVRRDPENPAR